MKRNGMWVLVAVSLMAGGVMAADTAAPGAWVRVFEDEAWYRQQAGPERDFEGTLEARTPPQLSTLMRTAWYQLGDWTLYSAARKHPALDALVGQTVVIRGKAKEMQLEGRTLREIWPARIRPSATPSPFSAVMAEQCAREFLAREQVAVTSLKAFAMPAPAGGWWMVEYRGSNRPVASPGPRVYVNEKTREVTRQAPKGAPALL